MTARSHKQNGTEAETWVGDYLAQPFPGIHRLAPAGANDCGDLGGVPNLTIQVKAHHKLALAGWVDEAAEQAGRNDTPYFVVIHKRWGMGQKRVGQWYVTLPLEGFAEMYSELVFRWRLDPGSGLSTSTIGKPSDGSS